MMNNRHQGLMAALVRFSLRHAGLVIVLASLLIGYGIYTLFVAKYDVFPEFAPPQVIIWTEAPGLSPQQTEVLVTQQIENTINGVPALASLRSTSLQGLSVITATFKQSSDIYRDRQLMAERLATLTGELPQGVGAPVMTPLTSSTSVVLVLGLVSKQRSLMDLRTIADWTVKPRLLSVPGVSDALVQGGEVKQLQIQVQPDKLIKYNLSMDQVLKAARLATGIRGAGFIENDNQRIMLQSEGQSLTTRQLAETVVAYHRGASVTLGDVARVVAALAPAVGAAAVMGKTGVVITVLAQYGANTLKVTRKIDQALTELRPMLQDQGITLYPALFRPANFIRNSIGNVKSSLLIGAVLVVLVLFLFLFDLRTAAISCTAIPLSLLAAVIVLENLGFSLNTMTLGGLAIAVGIVVDDAIIGVENILRRLKENRQLPDPEPVLQVVFDASLEVRNPVVYATFAVALVFIPILTLSGVAGRLFSPLGIAFILAIMASLLVALTVTPALSLILLRRRSREAREEPPVLQWLKRHYRQLLFRVEHRPKAMIAGALIFVGLGLLTLPFMSGSFLPELREGHFIVHMAAVPGTSLTESIRLGDRVTQALLKIPYIRVIAQRAGRAEAGDVLGPQQSEFEVDLKKNLSGEDYDRAQADIRRTLAKFPGANFAVNTFLTERMEEVFSGFRFPVVVNVFGNNLKVLDRQVQKIAQILHKIPGARDVTLQTPPGTPQLTVHLRKDALKRWGLDPVAALAAVRTAYQGDRVGQIYQGNRIFNVSVILSPKDRKSLVSVGNLPLRNLAGTYIPLRQVADIYETSGRYAILHEGARRVQVVTCNVIGRDISSFVSQARKAILAKLSFPAGTYLEFTGTYQAQAKSKRDLLVYSLMTGVGIILMLSLGMKRPRNLLLILVNLPFALVGGVIVVFASGGWLTLGSLVGFVTLFGITVRNSILMISHYDHLVSVEGKTWGPETAVQGASERLAPILMTALVTALGLLPLAIGSGAPGREIEGPMAMVILGGLLTSTALNLLVLPTLALRYGGFKDSTSG